MSPAQDGPAGPVGDPEVAAARDDATRPASSRCSVASREAGEPVEATAPHAVSWLGVVVPGSWPAQALTRLPGSLRAVLDEAPGVRAVLLRPVGRQGTDVGLVLAGTVPGRTWLREVGAEDTDEVLHHVAGSPDVLRRLATGHDPGLGRQVARPAVLVCTNGARDACCAREGRPAAAAVAARFAAPGAPTVGRRSRARAQVWESSHLGGHRFAPTAAVLPHGVLLGGLGPDPEPLVEAVADLLAGRTVLDGYRGRSTYRPAEQAAETAVRRHLAVIGTNAGPDDVRVDGSEALDAAPDRALVPAGAGPDLTGPDGGGGGGATGDGSPGRVLEVRRVFVRHSGGRTFRVLVSRVETDLVRPASCGAVPGPVVVWETQVDADAAPGIYLGG